MTTRTIGNTAWDDYGLCEHPRDGALGFLVRNKRTGIFAHEIGGCIRSIDASHPTVQATLREAMGAYKLMR